MAAPFPGLTELGSQMSATSDARAAQSKRYSVTALYVSMSSEQDTGVDDALSRGE